MSPKIRRRSFLQNLLNSVVGVVIGFVLVAGACVLLFYNEVRPNAADAAKMATELTDENYATLEGKAVWYKGELTASSNCSDPAYVTNTDNWIAMQRTAEVYVWVETEHQEEHDNLGGGTTIYYTYSYSREWRTTIPDSNAFDTPQNHQNPTSKLVPNVDEVPPALKIGTRFELRGAGLDLNDAYKTFQPTPETVAPAFENSIMGNHIYITQDPTTAPSVGDYRVSYRYITNGTSGIVLGELSDTTILELTYESTGLIKTTSSIYRFFDAETIGQVITQLQDENSTLTWILRLVGFVLMLTGFGLLFGPIQAIAGIIPFLKKITGFVTGIIAFVMALVLSLIVIIIANIINNIFALIAVLALFGILIFFGVKKARNNKLQQKEEGFNVAG